VGIRETLVRTLAEAVAQAAPDLGLPAEGLPEPELLTPRQKEHGDWSTNVALVLAKAAGRPPRDIARSLAPRIPTGGVIERVEVAGPGFVNLFLRSTWLHDVLRTILEEGPAYGRSAPTGRRVQVEYVSANPVGPLHVGTARNAALGDSVANLLEAAGWTVEREYYFNDRNRQIDLYAESVEARYLQRFGREGEVPEEGYHGEHVQQIADRLAEEEGDRLLALPADQRLERIRARAVELNMEGIRHTLERFRVRFDTWANEASFHDSGAIAAAVERLRAVGAVYERDGALFFRSTDYGDEKDRVLIRSDGRPTYFGADCAYVLDKAERGFDRLIYVWGADHHGTMKRLLGAAEALGVSAKVEILIYQLVSLQRGGVEVRMSKRAGEYVTLDELIDEVGADAARYTLVSRSADSAMDFDIEEVTRQSLENPVYYVQYAHARIASLLRMGAAQGLEVPDAAQVDPTLLATEPELDLLRTLADFPDVVAAAAEMLAPHRLTHYVEAAAAQFHRFYSECRVLTDDEALSRSRLALAAAAKRVVASGLELIGVGAPESMQRLAGDAEPA
jgi:arginyl-tRNA synthetase